MDMLARGSIMEAGHEDEIDRLFRIVEKKAGRAYALYGNSPLCQTLDEHRSVSSCVPLTFLLKVARTDHFILF